MARGEIVVDVALNDGAHLGIGEGGRWGALRYQGNHHGQKCQPPVPHPESVSWVVEMDQRFDDRYGNPRIACSGGGRTVPNTLRPDGWLPVQGDHHAGPRSR